MDDGLQAPQQWDRSTHQARDFRRGDAAQGNETREARAFLPQNHLQRWKCEQDADESARPRDQADKGNKKHYDAERALVQVRDEPRDRQVVRRRISEQCLQRDRRRDACAFTGGARSRPGTWTHERAARLELGGASSAQTRNPDKVPGPKM
jgi:hypothetical protein